MDFLLAGQKVADCMMQRRRSGEVHAVATIRMGPNHGFAKDHRAKRKASAPPDSPIEVVQVEEHSLAINAP